MLKNRSVSNSKTELIYEDQKKTFTETIRQSTKLKEIVETELTKERERNKKQVKEIEGLRKTLFEGGSNGATELSSDIVATKVINQILDENKKLQEENQTLKDEHHITLNELTWCIESNLELQKKLNDALDMIQKLNVLGEDYNKEKESHLKSERKILSDIQQRYESVKNLFLSFGNLQQTSMMKGIIQNIDVQRTDKNEEEDQNRGMDLN